MRLTLEGESLQFEASGKRGRLSLFPRSVRTLLLLCFFASGACGLIYQVVWLRVLGLIFGNTTFATSTVVAGFMAGLGLGALYFGRLIDRRKDPVRVYGYLEGGVALYSFLTPVLWKLIQAGYVHYYRFFEPSFIHFSLIKFVLSFAALLLPTFLMGGTFPVLSRYFVRREGEIARPVGLLYAWNTLGAVFGVIFTGFFALYIFGVWQTVFLAGAVNLVISFLCLRSFSPRAGEAKPEKQDALLREEPGAVAAQNSPTKKQKTFHGILLALFAVSGAVSMFYEIAWTRVLAIVLGSSVYAFSVMLATFLIGISLGSFLLSKFSGKWKPSLHLFAILQMLTACFVFLGLNRFDEMPFYFLKLFELTGGDVWRIELGKFVLCASVMLLPTVLIGALFACFIHVYHHTGSLGKEIGVAYFSNTLGNIFGAVLTGFFIIPRIGIQHTLMAAAGINAAIGVIAFLLTCRPFRWKKGVGAAIAFSLVILSVRTVHSWDKAAITSGAVVMPRINQGLSRKQFMNKLQERNTVYYKEGASSTVNVTKVRDIISLAVNGKTDASNGQDAYTQYLLGHLPFFYKPDGKKALIIGLGSGSTVAAVASHPARSIDVVEIEEAVVKGAGFFSALNRNALQDPRVKLHINDGRNFLLVSKEIYDVIISEPSNPWMAGVANLFSREYYQIMKEHLSGDGAVCQWLHAYSMASEDLEMIIRTFADTFEDVSLWVSEYPDLLLVGRKKAGPLDFQSFAELFARSEIQRDFLPYRVWTVEGLLGCFLLGDSDLRRLARKGRENRDNHPYLEFSAPRSLYRDTIMENFSLLLSSRTQRYPEMIRMEPSPERNAKFHIRLAVSYVFRRMFGEAQKEIALARDLAPNDPELLEAYGILCYSGEKFDEAASAFIKATEADPNLALSHYYLGLILKKQGQFEKALYELYFAAALDPRNENVLKNLGDILFTLKQYGPAMEAYGRYLKIRVTDYDVLCKMASLAFTLGDTAQQQRMADVLLDLYPKDWGVYETMGKAFEEAGSLPQALAVYRRLVEVFPDQAAGHLLLARVYGRLGNQDAARQSLRLAMKKDPLLKKNASLNLLLQ